MHKVIFLGLAMAMMALASCKKPSSSGSGSLSLKVNPMFGANAFKINSTYESQDGKYYYIYTLNMFLSHIRLIRSGGDTVEVNPVTFIRFNDSTGINPVISLGNPSGTFTAIQFSIGLDAAQDTNSPSANSSSPYFTGNGMNWGPALQNVFVELEGYADTNQIPVQSIGYHVGTEPYYTTVTLNKSFTLSGTSASTLNLNMDVQRLFYGGSNPINVLNRSEDATGTSPFVPALCQQFITNLDSAFSLQ